MKNDVRSALHEAYTEPIRDALWGHIYLTKGLAALTESSPFMRLHRIMQLGPAYRVYPGATHTRASHSLGVYHLARRLLIHLAEEGADEWLSPEGVKSFLCAALLHDLGHFPYTHSLKELPLTEHEVLTGNIISAAPVKDLVAAAGGDPYFTAAIVDAANKSPDGELLFYRKLLSGSLDPDKLDYLSRDAWYCGVPYGAQDVDFILSTLHPHSERGVDIDSRGVSGVESLLFSKYLMYRAVYWHRMVRSATAMVKKALLWGLESNCIAGEELYNLDDQGLFVLAAQRLRQFHGLMDSVRGGRLFVLAAEIPFDGNVHGALLDLVSRSRMEERLAAELSSLTGKPMGGDALIIDLPEPISFESGLLVSDEKSYLSGGGHCTAVQRTEGHWTEGSAFKSGLVDAFVSSLRIIRIFVDPRYEEEMKPYRDEILQTTQKWIELYKGSKYGST